jgi:hypothetical protein
MPDHPHPPAATTPPRLEAGQPPSLVTLFASYEAKLISNSASGLASAAGQQTGQRSQGQRT